jgi:orotate phosphoribosyltransferase
MTLKIKKLFRQYISHIKGGKPIGREGRIRVSYFLDLLSATHDPEVLDVLSHLVASYIQTTCNLTEIDGIAGPKRGNTLLIKRVAEMLRKPSGFVKSDILFGQWIEGSLRSSYRVLLLDDVASDGEMLCQCIDNLRLSGIFVAATFVLVNRPEGDARSRLKEFDTELNHVFSLDDRALARL